MRRRRVTPTWLQRLFLVLIVATALMVVLLEVFHNAKYGGGHDEPRYVLQRTFVAASCADKRLGNAMFIYAAVVGVARRLNASRMIQRSCRLAEVFELSAVLVDDPARSLPLYAVYEEYGRRASAYDVSVRKLPRRNTLLSGYFQSWLYFADAASDVTAEFAFPESTRRQAARFLRERLPAAWRDDDGGEHVVRVGVHVRRGDLLKDYFRDYGYTTADKPYFDRAMEYFRRRYSRLQFVVCSDDVPWAKENVVGDDVVYSEGHKDYVDLAILTQCNHTILSVGSFGWWAAWLANGTTIYYNNWPKEYSKLEYHVNKKTYFPTEWIPMK